MNSIIAKCIEELSKPEPQLDYVRGMLEACLTMSGGQVSLNPTPPAHLNRVPVPVVGDQIELSDEEKTALNAYEKGGLGKLST